MIADTAAGTKPDLVIAASGATVGEAIKADDPVGRQKIPRHQCRQHQ